MKDFDKLPAEYKQKLDWFLRHKDKIVSWEETRPEKNKVAGNPYLFTGPKGIYKPANQNYALSIRVMLSSRYPDQEIIYRNDGSWSFRYHQEENEGKAPDSLMTNKGLIACMNDSIPIGVAIQVNAKPGASYRILGLAKVTELKDGFFLINGYSDKGEIITAKSYGPFSEELDMIGIDDFDPKSQNDARKKVLREVVQRQGQKFFRESLLKIYNACCVISQCNVPAVLEAAHITPYLGTETNNPSNGFILRADIHTLWDLALIAINPNDMKVYISPALEGTQYEIYKDRSIKYSVNINERPSPKALQFQWESFLNKLNT